ncbi:MAG: YbaB/EbfC family nucleoid-associated protein [Maricaulaceae bacterium]
MKDFANMFKQVQEMQSQMTAVQDALEAHEETGQSGGGLVKVTLNGKGEPRGVSIDDSLMNADERDVLEDLIVAAMIDAKRKVEAAAQEKMKAVTGGLAGMMPPGFKLPF